jgi:hypothetical protein
MFCRFIDSMLLLSPNGMLRYCLKALAIAFDPVVADIYRMIKAYNFLAGTQALSGEICSPISAPTAFPLGAAFAQVAALGGRCL